MSLEDIRQELIDSIKDNLSVVLENYPIKQVSGVLEEIAKWSQSLGICNLLLYADTDRFCENLVRSGHTRRYFLKKSREQGNSQDYQLAISRWESFFDVVAAGDFKFAQEIASLSTEQCVEDGEYEDDFCYFFFFHQFVKDFGQSDRKSLESILQRYEAWLDGASSTRFNICQSFYSRNPDAFLDEFQKLIEEREGQVAEQRNTALAADMTFEPRSHVFVEGLALLRIAEEVGLETEQEYQYCPRMARLPMTTPFPDDIYIQIDEEIRKR